MNLDTTRLKQAGGKKATLHDNCTVLDVGSGAFPRTIEIRPPGSVGARQLALWDGGLDLSVNDIVIATAYGGSPIWRITDVGGSDSGAGRARVSQVWRSDFSSAILTTDANGQVFLGETANAKMTVGLTLNQGANDDEILTFKSSDVDHGVTDEAETDTYGFIRKSNADFGGLFIEGLGESTLSFNLRGIITAAPTGKLTSSTGAINFDTRLKSGTGTTSLGADGNVISFRDAGTTILILDTESTLHHFPGSDKDVDLITVQVTGDPTLSWDESEDSFFTDKGLRITGGDLAVRVVTPTATAHINQSSPVGTRPVLQVQQSDISEEIIWYEGESASGSADLSLVDASEFTTAGALLGWVKIKVEDNRSGGGLGTIDAWMPFYAIPTA